MLHTNLKANQQMINTNTYNRSLNLNTALNKLKTATKQLSANPIVDNIVGVTGMFIIFYALFKIACKIY